MSVELKTRTLHCTTRARRVEVTYAVHGSWLSPRYEVVSCPAMHDGETSCNRQCKALLDLSPGVTLLAGMGG